MPSKRIEKKKIPDSDDIIDKVDDAKSMIEQLFGNITKLSATKQIVLGTSSGWLTGYLAMRVGKTAAMALGGGIVLLEIANEKGYIKINWPKLEKNLDKVTDKIEEKITGETSGWMDKVERYLDKQVDKTENTLRKKQQKAKSWYSKIMGESQCQLKEVHIFLISFVAGIAIGIGTS